jgi:hypothetical protein
MYFSEYKYLNTFGGICTHPIYTYSFDTMDIILTSLVIKKIMFSNFNCAVHVNFTSISL